jgi:hypothetical protein
MVLGNLFGTQGVTVKKTVKNACTNGELSLPISLAS